MNDNIPDSIKYQVPEPYDYQFDNVSLDDPRVWSSYQRGDVVGVFQLETPLGKSWSKKVSPKNIEELSDVISILRPGPLRSGESDLYVKRKNGDIPIEYLDESLRPILEKTYGIICYQEQCTKIAMELGGFTESGAETLRKGIGKKLPEIISKCKKEFIEGIKNKGVIAPETGEKIFEIIQRFQRYGFNLAHGIEYAINSYLSMYAKVHFPTEFYCSWLTFSKEKMDYQEEIYELVQDARLHDIKVLPPDIKRKNIDFEIIQDKEIIFGLSHIRGVGESAVESIKKSSSQLDTFIGLIKSKLKRNISESLIKAGACDCYGISRSYMLRNLHVIFGRTDRENIDDLAETRKLTPKEFQHVINNIDKVGMIQSLREIIDNNICIKKRIPTIESKIKYLETVPEDTNKCKSIWEKLYLGLNLTCSAADDIDKIDKNTKTCRQVFSLPTKNKVIMHVVIDKISNKKTGDKSKNPGAEYCSLDVSDNTGAISGVMIWPDKYAKFKKDLVEDIVVCIYGRKDDWNGRNQIVVNDIKVIG